MPAAQHLLILGASGRAAAHSARRAGWDVACCDLFGDEDLRASATYLPVDDYPRGLVEAANRAPAGPWMYTGALENHPQLVARISRQRELFGNTPRALRRVRDPFRVQRLLAKAQLPALEVRPESAPPPRDGGWLRKPLRSAAGRCIQVWDEQAGAGPQRAERFYFQQRACGVPYSAAYLADGQRTVLIGVTRQFVGERELGAPRFAYCGSLGPVTLPPGVTDQIERTGALLAARCRLRGLVGGDFVFDGTTAWLTEINPRYTASLEVLEHAWGMPLLTHHIAVFQHAERSSRCETVIDESPKSTDESPATELVRQLASRQPGGVAAKLILYAKGRIVAGLSAPFRPAVEPNAVPVIADVPRAGAVIEAGRPVCSVLAAGSTMEACTAELSRRLRAVSVGVAGQLVDACFLNAPGESGKIVVGSDRSRALTETPAPSAAP